MHYRDLRDFIAQLQSQGELRRISAPVSPHLEMTALADRVLRSGGPALLFENPTGHTMPVLANLFGTPQRVARALGVAGLPEIRAFGEVLAALKEPEPPRGMKDLWGRRDLIKTLWSMAPSSVRRPPCQEVVWTGAEVDLTRLPIQHCWPGDVAPLITWGLTITRGPHKKRQNLGIYRQQVSTPASTPASPTPWRWPLGPIRPPFWARSRPCPIRCRSTSLLACCAVPAPKWPMP